MALDVDHFRPAACKKKGVMFISIKSLMRVKNLENGKPASKKAEMSARSKILGLNFDLQYLKNH